MPETTDQLPQPLPAGEFEPLISLVGNQEAKTAVATILLSQPDAVFNATALRNAVRDTQDEASGWSPKRPVLARYCERSLVPAGIVTEEDRIFRAEGSFLPQRLAFCGSILGWSLDFPKAKS